MTKRQQCLLSFLSSWVCCCVLCMRIPAAVAGTVSLCITGDVNFNPALRRADAESIWGAISDDLQNCDVLAVNHESTIADMPDPVPNDYKYEDPQDNASFVAMQALGVDWVGLSNNHNFDFWEPGVLATRAAAKAHGFIAGGLGNMSQIMLPTVFKRGGVQFALFSLTAQLCHKLQNGTDILSSCTCGLPGALPTMPPRQCYNANATSEGLWYIDGPPLQERDVDIASRVVKEYRSRHPEDIIVFYLHAGPNFEWHPSADREGLLRALSDAGADVVWGTSSHHLQRAEARVKACRGAGLPAAIFYGLGDLLFRFVPGVERRETCEAGMEPCEQFRPELSVVYELIFDSNKSNARSTCSDSVGQVPPPLKEVRAHPTRHDDMRVKRAESEDRRWIVNTFNELAQGHGWRMQDDETLPWINVLPDDDGLASLIYS